MHLLPQPLWLLIALHLSSTSATDNPLPTAIRKMSPDAGEKFYHHYNAFSPVQQPQPYSPALQARQPFLEADTRLLSTNASAQLDLRPAFAPLSDDEQSHNPFHLLRRLDKRQWACPGGTGSCVNIGYPNSCCQTGETCVVIQDTGLGPVGCCPSGSTCGGTIAGCASGNTPCGSDIGGGCCIPGYVCEGVGCVQRSTALVTVTQPSTSSTIVPPTTTSSTLSTTTTTPTSTTPSSTAAQPTTTTSQPASAPVRPTSSTNTICPTGFYACLATAGGGCCQTGRDCQTTSCPPPASSTTLVNTNGLTIAVPASGVPASTTGSCATGWFMCGKEAGAVAGCCPSGYGCGTASCSLVSGGATATVAKGLPGSSGAGRRSRDGLWWVGLVTPLLVVASCW